MMFKCILSALIAFHSLILVAQNEADFSFEIDGSINADTGVVRLEILRHIDYYPESVESLVAEVENGKFYFQGSIPYPQGFTLNYGDRYYSRIFVIEPGVQSFTWNLDSFRETPKINNQAMIEFEESYKVAFNDVNRKRALLRIKRDSLTQLYQNDVPDPIKLSLERELKGYYAESDSVKLRYISSHPGSYVAFWNFVDLFSTFGYETVFDSIVESFSDSVKNTYAGKALIRNIHIASMLQDGKKFPEIPAKDIHENKLDYDSFLENKYTLVDFWYNNCGPCVAQFPDLLATYEKYQDKGFEIIGISTDRTKDKNKWQDRIQQFQLTWPQYWDENGTESSKLSINKFPTSYLLDGEGKILAKDLKPVELSIFLEEKLGK